MAEKEELKTAIKAFRKKLRRMRLDDESRLSHGAMTGGHTSAIQGIRPPHDFPPEIWEDLVKEGRLNRESHGMFSLVDPL